MSDSEKFLAPKGDYKNLIAFQKTECIYDGKNGNYKIKRITL